MMSGRSVWLNPPTTTPGEQYSKHLTSYGQDAIANQLWFKAMETCSENGDVPDLFEDMPDWLDAELWREFITNRVRLKKPMTDLSQKRMLIKLQRWHGNGINVNECLERSLINGWKDIYEPEVRRQKPQHIEDHFARGFRLNLDEEYPKPH